MATGGERRAALTSRGSLVRARHRPWLYRPWLQGRAADERLCAQVVERRSVIAAEEPREWKRGEVCLHLRPPDEVEEGAVERVRARVWAAVKGRGRPSRGVRGDARPAVLDGLEGTDRKRPV